MWRFFFNRLFLVSPSYGASDRLCFVIVAFPWYVHRCFLQIKFGDKIIMKFSTQSQIDIYLQYHEKSQTNRNSHPSKHSTRAVIGPSG